MNAPLPGAPSGHEPPPAPLPYVDLDPPTEPNLVPVSVPPPAAPAPATRRGLVGLILIGGLGALVAVALGVYGRLHEPTFTAINVTGFSSGAAAKAWLATGAFLLALVQLGSAMIMYGRIKRIAAPAWIGTLHRWSGRVAVLLTVPVAVHCLYALGFQTGDATGTGALAVRVLLLRRVRGQDARAEPARRAALDPAGARRRRLHRPSSRSG